MMRVVAIGECMVELAQDGGGTFRLGYAGDTFNTAIYLSRLGLAVDYATALGDDPHSDGAIAMMKRERIGTRLVSRVSLRTMGLYLVENDPDGERHFAYWRDRAPIRDLFDSHCPDWSEAITDASAVYLSGISRIRSAVTMERRSFTCLSRRRSK
jgi:2-dehydro-3-deoxygluconokinase